MSDLKPNEIRSQGLGDMFTKTGSGRSEGLSGLLNGPAQSTPPETDHEGDELPEVDEKGAEPDGDNGPVEGDTTPPDAGPGEPVPISRESRKQPRRRQRHTTTVYVTEGVKKRMNQYRRAKEGRTTLDVVLEAISSRRERLQEVIDEAKIYTGPVSDLFPADESKVRYAGGGDAQIQVTPTADQSAVLDRLGAELGFATRSTWIAPVLNDFLPGRKDKPESQ